MIISLPNELFETNKIPAIRKSFEKYRVLLFAKKICVPYRSFKTFIVLEISVKSKN